MLTELWEYLVDAKQPEQQAAHHRNYGQGLPENSKQQTGGQKRPTRVGKENMGKGYIYKNMYLILLIVMY